MNQTVPPLLLFINTTWLKDNGFTSPFFERNCYFTTGGNYGENNRQGMILNTHFKKDDIVIWFGLHIAGCPPMLMTIEKAGKRIYDERFFYHKTKTYFGMPAHEAEEKIKTLLNV